MSALRSSLACLLLAPASMFAYEVFGEFLYWNASEEPSTLWANSVRFERDGLEVFEAENVDFGWDPGFRIGAGYCFDCDCWDVKLYWTWFRTSGSDSVERAGVILESQLFGGFVNGDAATSAKARMSLKYNMIDGELGREFCVCESLLLRPYIGLKGGWIDQSFCTSWKDIDLQTSVRFSATEDLTNDFWGIGPVAGVGGGWNFVGCFHIVSDFQASLLWGTWKNTDVYKNTLGRVINTNTKNTCLGSLSLRAFLGLGWEWDCIFAQLGYEAQIWFSQFRIATFQQLRLHGDLTLQGLTLRVAVEF